MLNLDLETIIQAFDHGTIVGASSPKAVLSKDSQSINVSKLPPKTLGFSTWSQFSSSCRFTQCRSGPVRSGQFRSAWVRSGQVTG
jgi:hypothetical protein